MKWTSANTVTIIRILFVPVFVVAFLSPWPRWIDGSGNLDFIKPWVALAIFVILSLTDSLDGYLARKNNQITNFGKFMDPLADKILVFAALISLVELRALPSWVVLIILTREFIISGARMLAASKGMVIAASWYGKAKTVTQIIAIVLFIVKMAFNDHISPLYIAAWVMMIIALLLTIISMIDYLYKCRYVFIDNNDADELIKYATKNNISISTAESITGGLISASLTSISGSSNVYLGGVASYAYSVKSKLLNVDKSLLEKHGAINSATAEAMAKGIREQTKSSVSVSTTGIAGPNSDEHNTPVGRVYIGISTKGDTKSYEFNFRGSRAEIRNKTAEKAIFVLKNAIMVE